MNSEDDEDSGWKIRLFTMVSAEPDRWFELRELFKVVEFDIPLHLATRYAARRGHPNVSNHGSIWMLFVHHMQRMRIENENHARHEWSPSDRVRLLRGPPCVECGTPLHPNGWHRDAKNTHMHCPSCEGPKSQEPKMEENQELPESEPARADHYFNKLRLEVQEKYQALDAIMATLSQRLKGGVTSLSSLLTAAETIQSRAHEYYKVLHELHALEKRMVIAIDNVLGFEPKRRPGPKAKHAPAVALPANGADVPHTVAVSDGTHESPPPDGAFENTNS